VCFEVVALLSVQGPAVWALRAQTDKVEYASVMRRILETTPNLSLREGMAVDIDVGPNDEVTHLRPLYTLQLTLVGLSSVL
jgi:tRNA U34 5-carboxymethylaminomethyl modifying enzyme MnmG/GidA